VKRPRLVRPLVTLVAASVIAVPVGVSHAAPAQQPESAAAEVARRQTPTVAANKRDWSPARWAVYITNQHRRRHGLVALRIADDPRMAAYWQSKYQAYRRTMSHYGPGGTDAGDRLSRLGYRWSMWGENVAAGQQTASQVVNAWLNSPGHRANMLNPNARHIGVARKIASNGVPYWTMVLTARG
jgi:uncharacterized protein YkwD